MSMPKYRVRYVKYYPKTLFVLEKRKWFFFWEKVYTTFNYIDMRNCIDSYGLDYK